MRKGTTKIHSHSVQLIAAPAPISVGKIICIGRNYADHAKEMRADIPAAPVFFLKPSTALLPDGGSIRIPSLSNECHHEVELTVLIGKEGKNIPERDALRYVAGYGVGLDMTLRDLQAEAKKHGLPWAAAKGFDTSAPVSAFVPASRIDDPHRLTVELRINGTPRQRGNTADLIFSIPTLIAYLSQLMTFEPGDILFTGTPEGVGPVAAGDRLEATLFDASQNTLVSLTATVSA